MCENVYDKAKLLENLIQLFSTMNNRNGCKGGRPSIVCQSNLLIYSSGSGTGMGCDGIGAMRQLTFHSSTK